jgi:hypothetical protein
VAIWTNHNWTEGVQPFLQPGHDSELTIFESARLHYRCFTLLILTGCGFVPAGDGPLTFAATFAITLLKVLGVISVFRRAAEWQVG